MSKIAKREMIPVTAALSIVGRTVNSQPMSAGSATRALTRSPRSADLPGGVSAARGDLSVPDSYRRVRLTRRWAVSTAKFIGTSPSIESNDPGSVSRVAGEQRGRDR